MDKDPESIIGPSIDIDNMTIDAFINDRKQWLGEAVVLLGGDVGANPIEFFPEPTPVRADAPELVVDATTEEKLREIAGRFGIGGEFDIRYQSDYEIIEGGKHWKIDAEIGISEARKAIIVAGSPHRVLSSNNAATSEEIDFASKVFDDVEGISEFDLARKIIESNPNFESTEYDETLEYGYDIQNNHALTKEPTGQLIRIGRLYGKEVLMLRVDREDYINEDGDNRYRNQPDSAALMGFVADMLESQNDTTSSVGLVTSNTYAGRVFDAVRAGVERNREFSVSMYGRTALAHAKGEQVKEPTALNQIPGELHSIATKLSALEATLQGRA